MKTALLKGESIVKEGVANRQAGFESVGGHLYLTSKRLIFESHDFNFQTGITIIDINDIANVGSSFPNALKIETTEKARVYFICRKRKEWVPEIENVKEKIIGNSNGKWNKILREEEFSPLKEG
ncbi:MAG: hypothetical protein HZB92_01210 [Euryarchaeota archaeon]|nr:hypothetical protein [Euryarchaeota archaeon]